MPSANLSCTRRLRGLYAFGIQNLCDSRKAIAIGVHGEDTLHNRSLFLIELQLDAAHSGASVLTNTSWIFDGDVAIPKAFSARLHSLQRPPFLPAMNFLAQANEELLVHHAVKCQEWTGCLFPAIQALSNRINKYPVIEEPVVHAQNVRQVTRQAGSVVHEEAVKWLGFRLRG